MALPNIRKIGRKLRELKHLSEVFTYAYDTFVIDLWGVMHNGA